MIETELQKASQDLLDFYRERFVERYKMEPVFSFGNQEQGIFKELSKKLSETRLKEIITYYLKMDDDWYVEKAHSVQELRHSINAINIRTPQKRTTPADTSFHIVRMDFCDHCTKKSLIKVDPNKAVDWTYVCDECKAKGIEPRYFRNDPIRHPGEMKREALAGTFKTPLGPLADKFLGDLVEWESQQK